MADLTAEQLKDAARRAAQAGDTATAKSLIQRAQAAERGEAPAPPQEPNLTERIMDGASAVGSFGTYAGQELARGVVGMAGAPVDLVNMSPMLLNLLPGEQGMGPMTEKPVGGSASLWEALTAPRDAVQAAAGYEVGDRQPANMVERVGGRMAEEVGAAALPIAGAIAGGARTGVQGARAMQESARPITRFTGRALESAATDPTKFALKEGMYAASAGTGAGVAREMVSDDPEEQMWADLIGSIFGVGGAVGAQYAGRGAMDLGRAVVGSDNFARDMASADVAARLGQAYGSPTAPSGAMDTEMLSAVLRGGKRVGDTVPGYRDSVADVTQNPGLAELEYSRQAGPGAGPFKERRVANQDAASAALDDVAPNGTPGMFSDAARTKRSDIIAQTEAYLNDLAGQSAEIESRVAPTMPSEARGQAIRGSLEDSLAAARAQEREAWSAVQGEVDTTDLAASFDEYYGGLTASEKRIVDDARAAIETPKDLAPGPETPEQEVYSAILNEFGRPFVKDIPKPVAEMQSLDEVTSLRSEFTDAARKAAAAGETNKARILGNFVDRIDAYLDTVPDVAEPLANARGVSRDLNDRFTRRGTGIADSLATRPSGGPTVPDSNVPRRFVQPDRAQAVDVDNLLRETNDAGEVRAAIQDEILDTVDRRGLLAKPDQLEAYLGEYSRVFEKFPDLKKDLGTAAGLRRQFDDASRGQAQMNRELNSASGNAIGRYLQYGDERAKDAMGTVLNAKDPAAAMDELLAFVDDTPEAVEGARAAFWDAMKGKTQSVGASTRTGRGNQAWRFNDVAKFVNDPANSAVLDRLYRNDPEHLARIRELAGALGAADFSVTGRAAGASGTAQGIFGAVAPSAESVGSRIFAVNRGVVSPQFAAFNLGSVMARKLIRTRYAGQFNELLDKALLDPDLAAILTQEFNPASAAALNRWAKAWGFTMVPSMLEGLDDGEGPYGADDLVDTIMAPREPLRLDIPNSGGGQ